MPSVPGTSSILNGMCATATRYCDRAMCRYSRNFFTSAVEGTVARGIDVGTGANLYPCLSMLPFCGEITLWERGEANVAWLQSNSCLTAFVGTSAGGCWR